MNERIRLLAEQANVLHADFFDNELEVEKFAELIVRKCAEIAEAGWAAPGIQIKRHFGVEE